MWILKTFHCEHASWLKWLQNCYQCNLRFGILPVLIYSWAADPVSAYASLSGKHLTLWSMYTFSWKPRFANIVNGLHFKFLIISFGGLENWKLQGEICWYHTAGRKCLSGALGYYLAFLQQLLLRYVQSSHFLNNIAGN